jgi:coproporphyrinogen III oxidase-like Fe-S oxidoreductase/wyosine [tRNA(Phe)-imidazoG37] synthetase (radical SAM superfamily)
MAGHYIVKINNKCNANCCFCADSPSLRHQEDFDYNLLLKELKENRKKFDSLIISGGEPTIYSRLLDYIKYAKNECHYEKIFLTSNGFMLYYPDFCDKLIISGVDTFLISFASSDEKKYYAITKVKNALYLVTSAIKYLKKKGVSVRTNTVIHKINYKDLPELVNYLINLKVESIQLSFMNPVGVANYGNKSPLATTFTEAMPYIKKAFDLAGKIGYFNLFIENIPPCIAKDYKEYISDFTKPEENKVYYNAAKKKPKKCKKCSFYTRCDGVWKEYLSQFGDKELMPFAATGQHLVDEVEAPEKTGGKKVSQQKEFEKKIASDLKLFNFIIRKRPHKEIYMPFNYFLVNDEGLKDETYIMDAWKEACKKIRERGTQDFLSLYINIPFCLSKCDYCIYPSILYKNELEMDKYLFFLIKEIEKYSPLFEGIKFRTLHIGGGTPSLCTDEQLDRLFSAISSKFEFSEFSEKAIEMKPEGITEEKMAITEKYGFNKISFGVQSLSQRTLKINKRDNQFINTIKNAISIIRRYKISILNADLILGLKEDTKEDFLFSFEELCKTGPDEICIYLICTRENYIKRNYGDRESFLNFFTNLVDDVLKELEEIGNKYSYVKKNKIAKNPYIDSFIFFKKSCLNERIDYHYDNLKTESTNILGLGFYSFSRIVGKMQYRFIDVEHLDHNFLNKFSTDESKYKFDIIGYEPNHEKVKFIIKHFCLERSIHLESYNNVFGSNFIEDFGYAVRALVYLKIIELKDDKIVFRDIEENAAIPYMLFFSGRDNVEKVIEELRQYSEEYDFEKDTKIEKTLSPVIALPEKQTSQNKHILGRIQITRRCNQSCIFCSAPPENEELSLGEIKGKILELKKLGTTDLMITGGEPTLHKDLIKIIEFCYENFPEITIQTNGSNLSKQGLLDSIEPYKKQLKFNISFHSYDKIIFSKLSRTPASYQAVIDGIKKVCKMGFSAYFTIVINAFNYKTLKEHISFISVEFPEITHFSFNFIDPVYNALNNKEVVPTFSETEKYIHETVDYIKSMNLSFRIEKMPLCYMSGFEEYCSDIRRGVFDEIRMMSFLKSREETPKNNIQVEGGTKFYYAQQCKFCKLNQLCSGINPNYVAIHGDSEVYPVFDDPLKIVNRIKGTKQVLK